MLANGGEEKLLVSLYDIMDDVKKIMDSASRQEMDLYCEEYDGFYCVMKLLESLAAGIADGRIPVPKFPK